MKSCMQIPPTSVDVVVKAETCPYANCGKIFTSKWSMTRHMRTHTGEKPFKCPVEGCEKEFIENCALKRHLHTHSNGKVFECSLCDMKFKYKDYFESHMQLHESAAGHIQPASSANSDRETQLVIDDLRATLVRISMEHHQELSKHLSEIEWLKRALLECSEALQYAIKLLKGNETTTSTSTTTTTTTGTTIPGRSLTAEHAHTGDELSAQSALTSLGQAVAETADSSLIPAKLVETVSKYNAENIANICKPHPSRQPAPLYLAEYNHQQNNMIGHQQQQSHDLQIGYHMDPSYRETGGSGPIGNNNLIGNNGSRGSSNRNDPTGGRGVGLSLGPGIGLGPGRGGARSFETNQPLVQPMTYYMPTGPLGFLGGAPGMSLASGCYGGGMSYGMPLCGYVSSTGADITMRNGNNSDSNLNNDRNDSGHGSNSNGNNLLAGNFNGNYCHSSGQQLKRSYEQVSQPSLADEDIQNYRCRGAGLSQAQLHGQQLNQQLQELYNSNANSPPGAAGFGGGGGGANDSHLPAYNSIPTPAQSQSQL